MVNDNGYVLPEEVAKKVKTTIKREKRLWEYDEKSEVI